MKKLVAMCAVLVLLVCLAVPASASTTGTVRGGWLRMRSAASFSAETIASYYTGTTVTILATVGSWYYVQAPDGKLGYMYASYIQTGSTPGPVTPTSVPYQYTAYVTSANGLGVRLRSGPATTYGIISTYSVGTRVTVLSRGSNWDYIEISSTGQRGYMMSKYLTTAMPAPHPTAAPTSYGYSYTAYVTSANGRSVNLRSGPAKTYSVITSYPVGTMATVLSHGAVWDYIQVGGTLGYMMTQYLTTSYTPPTSTLTGVSISTTMPQVGNVLFATVTPAGATVAYRWSNELGHTLGSGATYTVQGSDVGHRLMVTATGTGMTTGTVSSPMTGAVSYAPGPSVYSLSGISLSSTNATVNVPLSASVSPSGATATYQWYHNDGSMVGSGATYVPSYYDIGYSLYCTATGYGSYTGSVTSGTTSVVSAGTTPTPVPPVTQTLTGTVTLPAATVVGIRLTPSMSLNSAAVDYAWYENGVLIGTQPYLDITMSMVGNDIRLVVTAQTGSGFTGSVSSYYCLVQNGT